MTMIKWKRAVAAALVALAATTAAFGLITGGMLWIAFGACVGGSLLLLMLVGVYRRVGYHITMGSQQGMRIDQMRVTVDQMRGSVINLVQSNQEIRKSVNEVLNWDLRLVTLNAFREIVAKIEGIEQRADLLEEQLRAASGSISQVSEQAEGLESLASENLRLLVGVGKELGGIGDVVQEHVKNVNSHLERNHARLERLESVPETLDRANKRLGKMEKAFDEAREHASEGAVAAKHQAEELERNVFLPIKRLEKELGNGELRFSIVNDLTSLASLHDQLPTRASIPRFSGWALEPVPLMRMVEIILRDRTPLVVECGSGASTVVLAYALEKVGGKLIALEHLEKYATASRSELLRHGLEHVAEVRHAPIEPCSINGEMHNWYAKQAWSDLRGIGLFLVDGPPKAIGKQARYPAIPLLAKALSTDAVIVLDDTNRAEEKAILERWRNELPGVGELFNLGPNTAAFRWSGEQ